MEYRIEDFTIVNYKNFLVDAKRRFSFASFENIPENKPHILLRHDLDLSMAAALQIATIEHELGISATYFLLLHSPFYNLLDQASIKTVKKILALGHRLGLHFDSHVYNISNEDQLKQWIFFEGHLISKVFECEIKVFSFHLTNEFTMQCIGDHYGGMINVYSNKFKTEYDYCSDSYGIWRYKRLFDFISETESGKIQILTHPEWWVHDVSLPQARIKNIIDQKVSELYADADKNYIYKERIE